jgi:MFS family permease
MSTASEVSGVWSRGYITIFVATLFFWIAVWMNTAGMPLYIQHMGLGAGTIGFVFSAGAITSLLGRLFSGWAVDRIGAKWFLILGILLWVITAPATVIAENALLLMLFRLLQGLGLALFTGASLGYVVYLVPVDLRGTAISWWGLTNTVATAL